MTKDELTKQAQRECCSAATTAHHGGGIGRTFWNAEAFQFMYVPAFQFQPISGCKKYRFTAKDENGNIHSFDSPKPSALLTDIWEELPAEGVVELTVRTVNEDNSEGYLVGARTFFKLAPFSADLPDAKCTYKECAARAFNYIMNLDFIRYWIDNDVPDPNYILNVYPSKTHSAIIGAMLNYASVFPEKADEALKIAKNAADYLMKITPNDGPLNGVPPTYKLDYCEDAKKFDLGPLVKERSNTIMTVYPSYVGKAYLQLEDKIREQKYLDAAIKIGEFYLNTVKENGSWNLIIDSETGDPVSCNPCDTLTNIVPFLMQLYERTGEEKWKTLSDKAISFVEKDSLMSYNWEGQFEDSGLSANYSNLTHFGASSLVRHYAKYYHDDENKMKIADDLMRYIEDQFVVWNRPAPWNKDCDDTSMWPVPCALEQYNWYVPIDASAANIINTFIAMYKAGRGELHLAKAKALTDTITRVQHEDGMIPTHWMDEKTLNGHNFWINCMIASANAVEAMSELIEGN